MHKEAVAVTRLRGDTRIPGALFSQGRAVGYNVLSLVECGVDEVRGRPVCVCVGGHLRGTMRR